jgi:hypothetical protein
MTGHPVKESAVAASKGAVLGPSEVYGEAIALHDGLTAGQRPRGSRRDSLGRVRCRLYKLLPPPLAVRQLPLAAADMRRIFYLRTSRRGGRAPRSTLPAHRDQRGGFIGLESPPRASLDCDVTVVEQAPMLLSRGRRRAGAIIHDLHIERGADVRLGAAVEEVRSTGTG